ncbi:MAG: DUF2279 domain-containing protein [Flavobacteriales bacterium]|nr:DUF2279 domain-containing protein [Flavobacteriales bacterium]
MLIFNDIYAVLYRLFLWVLIFGFPFFGFSQKKDSVSVLYPSEVFSPKRTVGIVGIEFFGYTSSMVVLNSLWYKDYPRSSFHWFNDNHQWLQMDKIGHATTSYYVGKIGIDALRWSGVNKRKSVIYGGVLGLAFLTSVEVFDGISEEWGASSGDVIANISGAALLIGQELLWEEQRIMLKFSAHFSPYAQYRPNTLGGTWNERFLKDYNGQTYWLSVNLKSFGGEGSYVPKWLNLAIGYSADGMTGGSQNYLIDSEGNSIPEFERQRQFFLSLDIDLTKIKTKSPFVNTLLGAFGFVKIPMPTYEYGTKSGLSAHFLYF